MSVPTSDPSLPIACRFVSTDQWIVTHLDISWAISEVKQCLLSKFIPGYHPGPPCERKGRRTRRDRPLSPITFSSHGHGEDDADSGRVLRDDDLSDIDMLGDVSDDANYYRFKYTPARTVGASSSATLVARPPPVHIPSHYTLLAFSTGQLLEDHFNLGWYALRPYELLELYPRTDALVMLPRGVPEAYIRPYFETRVWALRVVGTSFVDGWIADAGRPTKSKGKERERRTGSGSGSGIWTGEGSEETPVKEKKRRKKMEWRERWVVIHQGVFNLCRDRNDPYPSHSAPLSALLAIRGSQQLQPYIASPSTRPSAPAMPSSSGSTPLSSPTFTHPRLYPSQSDTTASTPAPSPKDTEPGTSPSSRRIICAKFLAGPHPPPHSPTYPQAATPSYPHSDSHTSLGKVETRRASMGDTAGGWWRRGARDTPAEEVFGMKKAGEELDGSSTADQLGVGGAEENDDAVWIIMDLLTDAAFDNMLRIIHRHAPRSCSSSFIQHSLRSSMSQETSDPDLSSGELASDYTFPLVSDASCDRAGHLAHQLESQNPGNASTKALPYPEWRLAIVQRARKAGLGAVGRAMELVMFGNDDVEEAEEDDLEFENNASSGDPLDADSPVDAGPKMSAKDDERASSPKRAGLNVSWEGILADSESESGSESDESGREWEGWIGDLPRQWRVRARTEERRLWHLEHSIGTMTAGMERVSWSAGWAGEGASDDADADADEHYASVNESSPSSPTTGFAVADAGTELATSPRVLNSYSSADSLIRRTLRRTPTPRRSGTFEGTTGGWNSSSGRVRPRSPLASQVGQPAQTSSSATGSSLRSQLPLRMPIPATMRMTSLRTPAISFSEGRPLQRKDGAEQSEAMWIARPTQDDSSVGPPSAAISRKLLRPARLKLSLTSAFAGVAAPVSASSSPNSLESMRFVTPDSD